MKRHINNFFEGWIDWLWRKRSTGLILIRIGVVLLLATLGTSWMFEIEIPVKSGSLFLALDMTQGPPSYLVFFAFIASVVLLVLGVVLTIREVRLLEKKRAVAIEIRGLRDTAGDPLKDKIPQKLAGRREQILVDIRRSDGRILDPEDALQRVEHLPTSINHIETGIDRSDIAYVAGGLAPVPFSFLVGVLLDDESAVTLMDWDRTGEYWRSLNSSDDGERFRVSGMDQVGDAEEIVLSVSVSYPTDRVGIEETFVGQPIVSMTLPNLSTDGHWSEDKQSALALQFFDMMRDFCGTKVKRVNLVLAAQNSVVIRLGRIYDKRNLPQLTVWQYERGQTPVYPWGVSMPVAGNKVRIVRN